MAEFTEDDRRRIQETHDKVLILAEAVKGLPALWKRTENMALEVHGIKLRQEDSRSNFWQGLAVILSLLAIGAQALQVFAK